MNTSRPRGILKIQVQQGVSTEREIDRPLRLGRRKDNDIVLDDEKVADYHARLELEAEQIILVNLAAAQSIRLNEQILTEQRVVLRDGDRIQIGETHLWFALPPAKEEVFVVDLQAKKFGDYEMAQIVAAPAVLFRFPSEEERINEVYEIARQKFERLPISDMEKINLDAALNEAVGNAQRHAHRYDPQKIIQVLLICRPDCLVMKVLDQGTGFDYRAELARKKHPDAQVDEARMRYKAGGYGGLGIMLMLKCTDDVSYNESGNEVTLTKRFGPQPPGAAPRQPSPAPVELHAVEAEQIEPGEEISAEEVRDDDEFPETAPLEPGPQAPAPIPDLSRRATVRYFKRMNPARNFPLLTILSQESLKAVVHREVAQVEGKQEIRVKKELPILEIVPVFPGCLCTPPKILLDVTPLETTAKFWLTPHAEGNLEDARVEIWYQGKRASVIETPTQVGKQTWAKISVAFSFLAPVISSLVDMLQVNVRGDFPVLFVWLKQGLQKLGGATAAGMGFALLGLLLAMVLYWINRPQEADPVESLFRA